MENNNNKNNLLLQKQTFSFKFCNTSLVSDQSKICRLVTP